VHLAPAAVEHEQRTRRQAAAAGTGLLAEEEERVVRTADAESIEAGERSVRAKVRPALPNAVGVGGRGAREQRHDGALEVEVHLEVEILDPAQRGGEGGRPAPELSPGGEAVRAEEAGGDLPAPEAEGLLERGPPGVVLQRGVRPRGGERGGQGGQPKPDGEVQRGVPARDVAAVERGSDGGRETGLSGGVGGGEDAGRVRERREACEDGLQPRGVPQRDEVVRGAVRVVSRSDRRRRRALGPRAAAAACGGWRGGGILDRHCLHGGRRRELLAGPGHLGFSRFSRARSLAEELSVWRLVRCGVGVGKRATVAEVGVEERGEGWRPAVDRPGRAEVGWVG